MAAPTLVEAGRVSAEVVAAAGGDVPSGDGDGVTAIPAGPPLRVPPCPSREGAVAVPAAEEIPAIAARRAILDARPTLHAAIPLPAALGEAAAPAVLASATVARHTARTIPPLVVAMGAVPEATATATEVVAILPLVARGGGLECRDGEEVERGG